MSLPSGRPPKWAIYLAIVLLAWLVAELSLAERQQSATYDEADHIFAGYRYWTCSDFASNFETPPLVKLVSTIPLLFQRVRVPVPPCGATHSTNSDLVDAGAFLYSNDADSILFQTRLFASLFTVVLGALLFESAYVTFGVGPALIALTIFAFEPNVLAHGFLVNTDIGLTCCLYAAVYAFYLYLEKGTKRRLVVTGIIAGTTLAAKHSGLIVFPVLVTLALAELVGGKMPTSSDKPWTSNRFVRIASTLVFVSLIAYVTLWAFYGFRFAAQPHASAMSYTPHAGDNSTVKHLSNLLFLGSLRAHLLPEAYLFGFKHVISNLRAYGAVFVLGKTYPTGKWFYFPVVLLVKSTLGFLFLLLLGALALILAQNKHRRALSVLTIPPLLFLILCLPARLNIGVRHILPVYPFLIVLASAGAWEFRKYRGGKYVVASLIVLHVASSLSSFPNYIPYSNEMFGGTTHTYRVLADSNVDWGQSLKAIKNYVYKNAVKNCWLAYPLSAPPGYYQTGCKLLPVAAYGSQDDMSGPDVEGTLLIGTSGLVGPEELNAYVQFRNLAPVANIAGTVLVFRGRFDLPLAFALSQISRARAFSEAGNVTEAVDAARKAVGSAPDFFPSHAELARSLTAAKRFEDARREYQSALSLAGSRHAEYNEREIVQLETELRGLP